jgi:hypothetical protein
MPGALEALDAILHGVDGGALTAPEAIEQLLSAQIQLRNNRRLQAAIRSSRLPAVKQLHDFDFTLSRLKILTHPALLVVDEIGLPADQPHRRQAVLPAHDAPYEHASTVLTSNKGFED